MEPVIFYTVNKSKSEIEKEMYYLMEENFELERIIREAKSASKKLENNKEKLIKLALEYADAEGDM